VLGNAFGIPIVRILDQFETLLRREFGKLVGSSSRGMLLIGSVVILEGFKLAAADHEPVAQLVG
jgi:hypothetical protein